MRKIRIIDHISLDGMIQVPIGPKEDGDLRVFRRERRQAVVLRTFCGVVAIGVVLASCL
jgi:hypothetical protein